jgi:RND family efflux transporter MFP subunit
MVPYSDKIVVMVLVASAALFSSGAVSAEEEADKGRTEPAAPVKLEQVVKKDVRVHVTLIGTVEPLRKSRVASEIEGLVVEFPVRLGLKIKQGDVLARIDRTSLRLDLKEAEAGLAETRENYRSALSELKRVEVLFRQKTTSSREYDRARYAVSAFKQRITALEARIEAIRYDLKRCTIRAPFNGFVVAEHTQLGEWLTEGGGVVTIADIDPVLVTVPVPDRYIRFVAPGQSVDVLFEFLPEENRKGGTVRGIIQEGNEQARTFPVQVTLENKDFSILAGMSAMVRFPMGEPKPSLLVHKDAVVTDGDRHHVFIVHDGKARLVGVRKGEAHENRVAVTGEIADGDWVVVEGNERLRPGQPVRAIE